MGPLPPEYDSRSLSDAASLSSVKYGTMICSNVAGSRLTITDATTASNAVNTDRSGFTAPAGQAMDALRLTAYATRTDPCLTLTPAAREREWMDVPEAKFAQRCLPLLMANQAGWTLLSRHRVRFHWNGGRHLADTSVEVVDGPPGFPVKSHFGHGIVTWHVPYLFRTPPGWDLLARGPANWPKDGIAPLEGLVETDWSTATFTANWKLTRPDHTVEFEIGEPVALLVPQPRRALERFQPVLLSMDAEPHIATSYRGWANSRAEFNADLLIPGSAAQERGWQRDYFRGRAPDGTTAPDHQLRLRLPPFVGRFEPGLGDLQEDQMKPSGEDSDLARGFTP
jgi:hypothetical protein